LIFSANVSGKVTVTNGNKKVLSLSHDGYNLKENEEHVFNVRGVNAGMVTLRVQFEPTDNVKYNNVEKTYTLEVTSSCGGNVSENPPTGNILLFLVWMIGLGAIGYSFYCFKTAIKN